ncbi:MAG: TlpA family protein disulfide reductase [Bacteroidales bacterium]|nr:TlpA family protein disulfide reductase [Bacteroidales bacterium]
MLIDLKPGDKIEVYYDLNDFDAITIDGSESTELYMYYIKTVRAMTDLDEKVVFTDSLINANSDKLISLLFGFNLGFDGNVDTHKKLIDGLATEFSDNAIYLDYVSEFNSANATAIGSIPPDIELEDKDGNIVTLYSLRGQYVLLDFWAAWCRPCRGESPTLVSAYNKYHDDGFTIYSVSLDQTKDAWLKAIDDDGIGAWYHVSDLKGWQSSAGQLYGINSIPANFLIGPDGKIVAKNLRGASLGSELSDIFNH